MRIQLAVLVLLVWSASAHAYNALGHKVIADIAWHELKPDSRKAIVDTLRRHPRFDDDFAKQLPADADEDLWIFQQAAIWPDIARGFKGDDLATYNHGTWHYVNFPLFVGGERPLLGINLSPDYPPALDKSQWNILQAVKHCQATLQSDAPPSDKALAYCWLFHLVGDSHQPLHSTALFCEQFPTGDRGGNSIPLVQGDNLHSLWDGLLGQRDKPNDVKREIAQLRERQELWKVDTTGGIDDWIAEGHELAKAFTYSPAIIEAVQQPGELAKVSLSEDYLREAGEHTRRRVVAAGLRLAVVLGGKPGAEP